MLAMIPGVGKQLKDIDLDEREIRKVESIVLSMTPAERRNPSIINASRKQRIAKGSGVQVQQVNRLLKQFDEMKGMMKKLTNSGMLKPDRIHKPRNKKGKAKSGGKQKRPMGMGGMFSKFLGK
jgi:signal recognition particle subunit SRP54